ncbi:RNA polymerase-binding transcription factor DksA [Paraliobacillus ryukyuensis]|uniref:TraR/DksA family transcriptional regulator n=1 Tax=Paraliobacillus ryukyuensis TaxID=200904 RepID=A0A366EG24_9BACI|nr:TraR/DksA C4-type zinc finger protein [Paraliobacillus ryukyuensis]RBP01381.1 TraR/DksA family transcriptional regulator [Paraliobacillus ryukyuensis]
MTREEKVQKAIQLVKEQKQNLLHKENMQNEKNNMLTDEVDNELSNYDNHPADQGSNLFEREKDMALNEFTEQQMNEVEQALADIDHGTYGLCNVCGKKIAGDRLLAMPTTQYCIDHATDNERINGRPVENNIFEESITANDDTYEEDEETGFDREDTWQAVGQYGSSNSPSDFTNPKADYEEMYIDSEERAGKTEPTDRLAIADFEGDNQLNQEKKKKK